MTDPTRPQQDSQAEQAHEGSPSLVRAGGCGLGIATGATLGPTLAAFFNGAPAIGMAFAAATALCGYGSVRCFSAYERRLSHAAPR